jgi:hypothetical protein
MSAIKSYLLNTTQKIFLSIFDEFREKKFTARVVPTGTTGLKAINISRADTSWVAVDTDQPDGQYLLLMKPAKHMTPTGELLLCWRSASSLRQVLVVGCTSLPLNYTHQFFLSFSITSAPIASCTNVQHQVYNHIGINHVSILSPSQFHESRLNYFRIHLCE